MLRAGLFASMVLAAAAFVMACLSHQVLSAGPARDAHGAADAAPKKGALLQGTIREFNLMGTYRTIMQCDPFRFHCPLPLFDRDALKGKDPQEALQSCCHDYAAMPLQWPYQFPECRAQASCPTCWEQSGAAKLLQHPVAGLAAVGYAASVAVGGPTKMAPSNLKAGRAPVENETMHAGLPSKQIVGPVHYGSRTHYSNLCPLVNDWEEYSLNDARENTHVRVFRSPNAKLAVVSFRGTQENSAKNWETDADVRERLLHLGEEGYTAMVHEGFLTAAERVLLHIRKWVEGYASGTGGGRQVPTDWKLIFTGHSLGGALATITATLAETQGWSRKPDAVITFGAPRVADGNLSKWWEERGLCGRLLRINVYNDLVHWMPFSMGRDLLESVFSCTMDLQGCLANLHTELRANANDLANSERWAHVCPTSEFVVPGALKGVNSRLHDFSPLGGVLAHFLSNGLFGYGFGIVSGGVLLHDEHCGMMPSIFPKLECSVIEDLTGVRCFGLQHDEGARGAEECKQRCCDDPYCEVWQAMRNGACWRGRSHGCSPDDPMAKYVLVAERLH